VRCLGVLERAQLVLTRLARPGSTRPGFTRCRRRQVRARARSASALYLARRWYWPAAPLPPRRDGL